ncbi:MFS transporter [Novosphingobium piscinae]|uniref:MFS transporter n=1 Tax=Novosphingobium piscinae TaxID=1507448 RepID=A0A7X1KQ31_9SPHN|nr:MFS transporter [Novosphingobium piscinae]MBC2669296.1 MFS transporter [Novosphingobium piscinae]
MAKPHTVQSASKAPLSAWLLTLLLTGCYVLSVIDRNIISFVAVDIKRDLGISDLQLGMVQGFAFSIFYAVAGLPLGWAIDRFQRRRLLAAALFVWSGMTMLCGAAQSFLTLAIGRVGVGAGEAALTPGSYSMMSDVFAKSQFARASAIYSLGPPLAAAGAAGLSGFVLSQAGADGTVTLPFLGTLQGWRALFIIAGAPGLVLAAILLLVSEPARSRPAAAKDGGDKLLRFLAINWRTHGMFCIAVMLSVLIGTSYSAWVPATLERTFGWNKVEISKLLAVVGLVCGISGSFIGGVLSSWLIARDRAIHILYIGLGCAVVTLICGFGISGVASSTLFLITLALAGVIHPLVMMISPTFLQIITPANLRGRMTAAFLFINIGVGSGAGPTLVGFFSTYVFGAKALPSALGTVSAGASVLALAAYFYVIRKMPAYFSSNLDTKSGV